MKIKLIALILVLLTLTSSCSLSETDDLSVIELHSGYAIIFVTADRVVLCKAYSDRPAHQILIENYFVTEYIINEAALFIKGVTTKDRYATDDEIRNNDPVFYLVDTKATSVVGPFLSEVELNEHANQLGVPPEGNWNKAERPGWPSRG